MKKCVSTMLLLVTLMCMLCIPDVLAGEGVIVAGKILLRTSSGTQALTDAKVELLQPDAALEPDADDVIHQTYTVSEGKFTFHNVKPGKYQLRVLLGEEVLKQESEDKLIERREVIVPEQNTRLPQIIVR